MRSSISGWISLSESIAGDPSGTGLGGLGGVVRIMVLIVVRLKVGLGMKEPSPAKLYDTVRQRTHLLQ